MIVTDAQTPAKTERIATRVTPEHKSLFGQAAILRGLSLTDFMVNAAFEAAVRTLKDSKAILELGEEDTKVFVEEILKPVETVSVEQSNLYKAIQEQRLES